MSSNKEDTSDNVRVCCRVRPPNEKERGIQVCVDTPNLQTIGLKIGADVGSRPGTAGSTSGATNHVVSSHSFSFDRVFPIQCAQKTVYEYAALPTVKSVMQGFNGTVFAYGQTASGKTFTMQGPDIHDEEKQGVIPRMVWTIFDAIYSAPPTQEFLVKVSIVELYMEKIRCLLDPAQRDNLKIKERPDKGIFIENVTESYVQSEQEIFDALHQAQYNRTVGATNMNAVSSRSHMIFQLLIENKDTVKKVVKRGKLNLVDLAGSEKIQRTGATGNRLEEAKMINKSLSALGNVINALTEPGKAHVPYRDSKLTRLLSESLGGNAKTTLIITVSPSVYNDAETLSTLRFGQRAKMIKNKAVVNEDLSVEALQAKVLLLKDAVAAGKRRIKQLEQALTSNNIAVPAAAADASSALLDAHDGSSADAPSGRAGVAEGVDAEAAASMREEVEELQRENAELRAEMESIEKSEKSAKQQLNEITSERDHSKYEREELQAQLSRLQADVVTQKAETESMKLERKNLKAEVLEAKEQVQNEKVKGMGSIARKLEAEKGSVGSLLQIASRELLADDEVVDASCKMVLTVLKDLAESHVRVSREHEMAQQTAEKMGTGAAETDALLREREAAVTKLEVELANERERVADLHEKLKDGDRPLKRKVSQLDKNLEQLTVMYHKLVSQNSGLKVECQVNEKRVIRKDQRIATLETSLRDAKTKYEKLLTQCANLTAAMDMMGRKDNRPASMSLSNAKGRLMRPLQGGVRSGGSGRATGMNVAPEQGAAGATEEASGRSATSDDNT